MSGRVTKRSGVVIWYDCLEKIVCVCMFMLMGVEVRECMFIHVDK